MKRYPRVCLTLILTSILLGAGFAQGGAPSEANADVSGKWAGSFNMTLPDGTVHNDTALLNLKWDGTTLSGSVGPREDQQSPIKEGTVHGQEVMFKIDHDGSAMVFRLHLAGNSLSGEVTGALPGGAAKVKLDTTRAGAAVNRAPPISQNLYDEIFRMDTMLFEAFNSRDLLKLRTLFAADLEFYHDKGGLTSYEQNMEMFKANFARDTRVRRELVSETLEVYPISGYGAVELGVHRFYTTDPGQQEKLTATAKFIHLWRQKDGEWKISRVISYDHL